MKRILVGFLCCFALLSFSNASLPIEAQTTTQVSATPLFRFRVSNDDLGFLYTANFQEGQNAGYTPFGVSGNTNGIIGFIVVPPTTSSTPVAGQGLQPLYRWRVVEDGRTYYYITPFLGTNGSNYTLEGIIGYTFNLFDSTRPGFVLNAWYSQRYGYWYALIGERQPDASFDFFPGTASCDDRFTYTNPANGLLYCSTYRDHDSICKLLQSSGGLFTFTTPAPPPPPPPGGCSVSLATKSKCAQLGGSWDDECCCCSY